MKRKKRTALLLSVVMALTSPAAGVSASGMDEAWMDAQVSARMEEVSEYVVLMRDSHAAKAAMDAQPATVGTDSTQADAPMTDDAVEELQDHGVAVLTLTEEEAGQLENREEVLMVEKNILLEANTMEQETVLSEEGVILPEETEALPDETEALPEETEELPEETEELPEETEALPDEKPGDVPSGEETDETPGGELQEIDCRSMQWNLDAIHLPDGGTEAGQVRIAILDSGVSFSSDLGHVENRTIEEEELSNVMFDDGTGHGTGMAGVICAQDNAEGIRGINPAARICSIRILDEKNQCTLSQAVAGIYQAVSADCDILNMSFGTNVQSGILHQAIRDAYDAGMLLVAAGGNQAGAPVEYPAAYAEVMAVGASDATGNKMAATSDGPELEILAPGSQVPTVGLFGGVLVMEGTSISAAQVSGAASLLWAKDTTKSAGFIRSLLSNTSRKCSQPGVSGAGVLDISKAFELYETLEQSYAEQETEYLELQEEAEDAETFTGVELVNGSWLGDRHDELIKVSSKDYGVKSEYISLMTGMARLADKKYDKVRLLHGKENYVLALKYLYRLARSLKNGKSINEAMNYANTVGGKQLLTDTDGQALINCTKDVLNKAFWNEKIEKTKEGHYFKIMGLAMHVVGDTFAHRTIVPDYTIREIGNNPVYSTNGTSYNARFGSSTFENGTDNHTIDDIRKGVKITKSFCRNLGCMKKAIEDKRLEFRDIKCFSKLVPNGDKQIRLAGIKVYEDNPEFCTERYMSAYYSSRKILEKFFENKSYDGVYIFWPEWKKVRLNNFKRYATEAGESTSAYNKTQWDNVTTQKPV